MSIVKMFSARRPHGDDGVALLLVISCMMIGTLFAFAALSYALNTQTFSRSNQDWNAALAAAQAGVDDYVAELNKNDNYARDPIDCTNEAMWTPTNCTGHAGPPVGFKDINVTDPTQGSFHYDIDVSKLDSNGNVLVTSTGKSGTTTRTLQVGVGKGDSTHFLYYTDHEDADPDNEQAYPGTMPADCAKYWWAGRDSVSGCSEITFIGGDELDGLAHTNDTPLFTNNGSVKPKFSAGFEMSDPDCMSPSEDPIPPIGKVISGTTSTYKYCDRTQNSADYGGSYPRWAKTLDLPDNSDLFKTYPGCQYTGSTRIKFLASGQMRVWSKGSTLPVTTAACGGGTTALTTTGAAAGSGGALVNVPTDQVVYVASGASGAHQCNSLEIGDGLPLGTNLTGSATTAYTGYDQNMILDDQWCGKGNAYIEGVLKGRVTIATENSLVLTGDVVYANGLAGSDMLGLVAANSIEVYHPWVDDWECKNWNSSHTACKSGASNWGWDNTPSEVSGWPHRYNDVDQGNVPFPATGIQVAGSIQTLQHSFFVQSYAKGTSQGKLYVRGSIAQRWRGIVGTSGGSTGYFKSYKYDKRLKYSSPPYFPDWTNSEWSGNYTGEISPRYR